MYHYHLREMVVKLIEAGLVDLDTAHQAKEVLASYWEDKIASVWSVEDVEMVAEERGRPITRKFARRVLKYAHEEHNAEVGINWAVLETIMDELGYDDEEEDDDDETVV